MNILLETSSVAMLDLPCTVHDWCREFCLSARPAERTAGKHAPTGDELGGSHGLRP